MLLAVYDTPEWKDKVFEMYQSGNDSIFDVFLLDPGLFLKNYSHTLFNHVPDKLFNNSNFSVCWIHTNSWWLAILAKNKIQ